jgi:hypothetical protein
VSFVADSTLRACDYPTCAASYDAVAVISGLARADGWLQLPSYSLHMCGEHSGIWREGRHVPGRANRTGGGICSCGAVLALAPSTLGTITNEYLAHLAEQA